MTIKKWNEIEHSFTSKFGWYEGLRLMVEELRIITKGELNLSEVKKLLIKSGKLLSSEMGYKDLK